jgi:hypothetical protein
MLLSGCNPKPVVVQEECVPVGQIPDRIKMSVGTGDFINKMPANQEFDKWLIQISNQQGQLAIIKQGYEE